LSDQWDLEIVGQELSASGTEDFVALAFAAGEPAHVLNHAVYAHIDLGLTGDCAER
jgi:hypothetical protein